MLPSLQETIYVNTMKQITNVTLSTIIEVTVLFFPVFGIQVPFIFATKLKMCL